MSPIPPELQSTYRDVKIPSINKGMIQEEVMSYYASPDDSLSWLENADNDASGIITTRREIKADPNFSGFISSPVKAFQVNNLYNNDKAQVFWQEGRNLKQQPTITTGASTTYTNFFATIAKNRYDILQQRMLLTNVGAPTAVYYHNGNTTDPTASQWLDTKFPNTTDLICAGFNGRVWGAGTTNSIPNLYYSDVIPVNGITYLTTATQQYLGLNLGNEAVSALIQTSQVLFVFSMNKILRVFGINSLDNFSISNVGTISQESVMRTPYGIFFYHPSGIYAMSETGQTQCISDAIYYLLKRVAPANQSSVFCWSRDQFSYFYLGNLTGFDSNKYYFVKYNLVNKTWSIHSTKTPILCATSGYLTTFGATESATTTEWYPDALLLSASKLAKFETIDYSTDGQNVYGDFNYAASPSENIDIDVQTKWITFESSGISEARYKRICGLAIPHINGQGLNVAIQMDTWNKDKWEVVGTLNDDNVTLFRDYQSSSPFNKVKFRYYGTSLGGRIKFGMPTILGLDDQGYLYQ